MSTSEKESKGFPAVEIAGLSVFLLSGYLIINYCKVAPSNFHDWAEALAAIATLLVAGGAYAQYVKQIIKERQEFLIRLHERFYSNGGYSNIRKILDWYDETDPNELFHKEIKCIRMSLKDEIFKNQKRDLKEEEINVIEEFTNYLNFFLQIAILWEKGILKKEDIKQNYLYYLKQLRKYEVIYKYVDDGDQNFTPIRNLLNQFTSGSDVLIKDS